MSARTRDHLTRLQESLMQKGSPTTGGVALVLPFFVGSAQYAIAYSEVARVAIPDGIAALGEYPDLPPCVVGVVASGAEILTVVDVGVLLGVAPVQASMKSRLVVTTAGDMQGFALLVSRVMDLTPASEIDHQNTTSIDSSELSRLVSALRKDKK